MNDGGQGEENGREGLALVAVAVAVGTWCASNVVIKLTSVSGLVTSFYRLWLAVAFLWPLAAVTPAIRRGLDRHWLRASIVGGSLFGLHQILFFTALKMTSVINVGIIGALQPVIVLMVAGRMFGEEATLRTIAWALIAVGGTAMVVFGAAGSASWSPLGDLIATLNLFAFTAYFLYSKRIRAGVGATAYVVGMTTMAGVVVLAAVACYAPEPRLAAAARLAHPDLSRRRLRNARPLPHQLGARAHVCVRHVDHDARCAGRFLGGSDGGPRRAPRARSDRRRSDRLARHRRRHPLDACGGGGGVGGERGGNGSTVKDVSQ